MNRTDGHVFIMYYTHRCLILTHTDYSDLYCLVEVGGMAMLDHVT